MTRKMFWRLVAVCLFALFSTTTYAQKRLMGRPLSDYILVYSCAAENEEGVTLAKSFAKIVEKKFKVKMEVLSDSLSHRQPQILIGATDRGLSHRFYDQKYDLFDYAIHSDSKNIALCGGGNWAIEKAFRIMVKSIESSQSIDKGHSETGNIQGEYLFPRADSCNLRILNQNVWCYDADTIPRWWRLRRMDCRNAVRAQRYADIVAAYKPDVITLQEYSKKMNGQLESLLAAQGYVKAYADSLQQNYTPVFYLKEKFSLVRVEQKALEPKQYNDKGMNSYTMTVLKYNKGGKQFAVFSTHLWSKFDRQAKGSNAAKVAQVQQLAGVVNSLKESFDIPNLIAGDMSSTLSMLPMKELMSKSFLPCVWKASKRDFRNGYHQCGIEGYSREQIRPEAQKGINAQSHIFVGNVKEGDSNVVVRSFMRITPYFALPLSPHSPCYIDAWVK